MSQTDMLKNAENLMIIIGHVALNQIIISSHI